MELTEILRGYSVRKYGSNHQKYRFKLCLLNQGLSKRIVLLKIDPKYCMDGVTHQFPKTNRSPSSTFA
jgi:hypothetical protein